MARLLGFAGMLLLVAVATAQPQNRPGGEDKPGGPQKGPGDLPMGRSDDLPMGRYVENGTGVIVKATEIEIVRDGKTIKIEPRRPGPHGHAHAPGPSHHHHHHGPAGAPGHHHMMGPHDLEKALAGRKLAPGTGPILPKPDRLAPKPGSDPKEPGSKQQGMPDMNGPKPKPNGP